ncbi:glycine betaine ABC transporter substrate-binding protein [Suttonella ornithocola]|uniref:Glycine betaine/L-proline transport system permease protein proW n=1 Tax=Suttonella ornithocola TaxID=279832 RepID=A0A380MYN8_9GAMM|nr:glycine betaine ABC transporter substrate-binding protein [Suttonella ornithocola]SUO97136.1 Glycine betaine/L-proline transport system permease protein proW [Suttonella ornithocola]
MPFFRRLFYIVLLGLCFITQAHAACEQPIKFGALTWESGQFTTALLRILLEDGYRCPTTEIPGTGPALETALSQNDIQVIAEQWVGRSEVMQKAVKDGKAAVIGDTLQGGAKQGWYIPAYTLKAHPELKRVEGLATAAKYFIDPEDPTKARFLNCPSGWTCEIFNTHLLKNTGLANQYNNVHPGTGAALDAAIASAYAQKKDVLFYYWQPTAFMAKYNFKPIEFPPYDENCWNQLLQANSQTHCVSGFPSSQLAIAVSTPFREQYPDLVQLFERVQLTPEQLNGAILAMNEHQRSGEVQARVFLKEHPELWQRWLGDKGQKSFESVQQQSNANNTSFFPEWSLQAVMNRNLQTLVQNYGAFFHKISDFTLGYLLLPLEKLLMKIPPWLWLLTVCGLAWHATRCWIRSAVFGIGLFLIGAFGLWNALMQTIALLIVSVGLTVVLGVPLGITMGCNPRLRRIGAPVLDVMQTMPSFVYLIPVLMLFGLGKVPAVFATVVYALAPLVRLTALGIEQVNPQLREAAQSFGSSRWQLLLWVLLPLAKPSIMAGINQAVMMSLSMVVLASMIGAPGLGEPVLQAIQTLNIGQGIEAGTAIVILAIIIDRITQAYGRSKRQKLADNKN